MHARNVRFTAASFALALAGAAAMVAWWSTRPQSGSPTRGGASIDGGQAFARHCERCHAREELTSVWTGREQDEVRVELLELLADHGASSDDEDRAIAEWLLGLAQSR